MAMKANDENHQTECVGDISELFLSHHLSDLAVYVGPSKESSCKFHVHQLVLTATSPVFTAMLNGNYAESKNRELVINDITPNTFYRILKFSYKGILDVSVVSEALQIVTAADKYEMVELKSACIERMRTMEITVDNFCTLFNYYNTSNSITGELEVKIFLFLDQNVGQIMNHKNFASLDLTTIRKIVTRDTLTVDETDLCDALHLWSVMQCAAKHLDITAANRRQCLEDCLANFSFLQVVMKALNDSHHQQTTTVGNLSELFLSQHLTDFTVYVGPCKESASKFPVHQLVLAATSPVFMAMLTGDYVEKEDREVVISDIAPNTFYKMLLFAYKGILDVRCMSEALDILIASDKYEMTKLKTACDDRMHAIEITMDIFWCIHDSNLITTELKIEIWLFLDKNIGQILKHENFASLDLSVLRKILKRDTLVIVETDLCDGLDFWSKMQCAAKHLDITAANQRQCLADCFYLVRFATMDDCDLQKCKLYRLLTSEEKQMFSVRRDCRFLNCRADILPGWDYNLSSKDRGDRCIFLSKFPDVTQPILDMSTYFVFAKDAFVHRIDIKLLPSNFQYGQETITVEDASTGEPLPVKLVHDQKLNALTVLSLHVKAFTVYLLDSDYVADPASDFSELLWGRQNNETVFYTVSAMAVEDKNVFMSSEYWMRVFARRPPKHDDGVVDMPKCGSSFTEVHATIC